jgi:DnaJ-class molecular chaperone
VKIPEQIKRLGAVLGAVIAVVLLLRLVILPADMFSAKPHQAAKVVREMAKPVHYAGMTACRKCHGDVYETKYAGHHRDIGCENCHGAAADHAADPASTQPPLPTEREFCYTCHAFDPSRPNGFPQIEPTEHNPRKKCIRCHDPHDPVPPVTPSDCSACHGTIAKTKATSSHATVECTACHEVAEQHLIDPRSALPTKPQNREFCGQCHGKDATEAAAPKVNLKSHGSAYKCWDCHYPHAPEMKR